MRKKGIIILIVIIVIFAVVAYFNRDHRIEKALEGISSSIAGAKVEIDNFHFSLFKLTCSWDRLQIADKNYPWKNVLETGRTSFVLETRPLFWKRIIIKEMMLENVRNGTQRATDGSLPEKKQPPKETAKPGMIAKASADIEKQLRDLPVFDLSGLSKKLKIDSLIDVNKLASVRGYKKLNLAADSSFKYWGSQVKTQTYLDRIDQLEKDIKSLQLDKIKDVAALTTALKKLDNIQKEINSLKNEVQDQHKALSQTLTELQNGIKSVQSNLKNDINRAKQLAHLKELDIKDISLLLFGAPVVNKTKKILNYVALGRKYLPTVKKLKGSKKADKPPRFKGQNIHFPFHYRYPRFLLRQAKLSAATAAGDTSQAYFINGSLNGLTNEPAVFGKPTNFTMELKRISGNQYEVTASLDHISEIAYDSLWVSAKNFALGEVELKKSKYFPSAVKAKKSDINLAGFFIGDGIDLKLNLTASPVTFIFQKKTTDKISKIVQEVLSGLNQLTLMTQLKGDASNYKMRMNSNVDKVLAGQVKRTLEKNLREAQRQVENYVRAEADKHRKQVEKLIDKNKKTIYAELDKAEKKVQEQVDKVEKKKKEVEERIEQEKKKLGDKAKNKLKDLFKKP